MRTGTTSCRRSSAAPEAPSSSIQARSIARLRLLDEAIVEEVDDRQDERADARRRSYRLTKFGRAVLKAEAVRLEQQVRAARARRLLRREER
jgi:hypothetical protein